MTCNPVVAWPSGCINADHAQPVVRLNASALYNPNVLMPSVTIDGSAFPPFKALVDSGSTHCFVDPSCVSKSSIPSMVIPSLTLRLFNGFSAAKIDHAVTLPIRFLLGHVTPFD